MAVIEFDDITLAGPVTDTPLNRTSVTPERSFPLIVTNVPTGPEIGVKDVMTGKPWGGGGGGI